MSRKVDTRVDGRAGGASLELMQTWRKFLPYFDHLSWTKFMSVSE